MKKDVFADKKNKALTAVVFSYLNKSEFDGVAGILFNILADNMTKIAPTGNTREVDFGFWYNAVKEGLSREERQIILMKVNGNIAGYFQYYVNSDTFMMEEIQIIHAFKGTGVFRDLYGFLISEIPESTKYVEAYANINNLKSIEILKRLSLEKIGKNKNGNSYHFKGKYVDLIKWYNGK